MRASCWYFITIPRVAFTFMLKCRSPVRSRITIAGGNNRRLSSDPKLLSLLLSYSRASDSAYTKSHDKVKLLSWVTCKKGLLHSAKFILLFEVARCLHLRPATVETCAAHKCGHSVKCPPRGLTPQIKPANQTFFPVLNFKETLLEWAQMWANSG